eukprot:CAMPEP_0113649936 /NCGR_PEP_ID=MMETSP0017_2-20120614/26554_1 /TAXON_ID=2856 /ORGANISM="Cylindrotheca closterium" /LENGTH=80 /DNA_ID=CAMNT_0000562381 /DNA_START=50 /DNA_END=288 /DNA_ORIENTATION=- /assembly_acc=CAM_ASM_000147
MTSEPVWADPNGEFVAVIILFLIIKAINGFPLVILPLMASGFCLFVYSTIAMQRSPEPANLPKIRGLQQGSIALDPVEKA